MPVVGSQRLTEKVVEVLTEQIVSGHFSPGQLLPTQKEMAKEMGVSLTVTRESLKILHAKGLLRIKHGVGTFVNPTSEWDIGEPLFLAAKAQKATYLHWLETRTILEVGIAGLAAERATKENLESIANTLQRMRDTQAETSDFNEADFSFHVEVARATQNPSLVTLIYPLLAPLKEWEQRAANVSAALAEHENIYVMLSQGDAESARHAMQGHLTRVLEEEVEALTLNQNLFDST